MKSHHAIVIFAFGVLMGVGGGFWKAYSDQSGSPSFEPIKDLSADSRFRAFSRPGSFDFYRRISKGSVNYSQEILRLIDSKSKISLGFIDLDNISFLLSIWAKKAPHEALEFAKKLPFKYSHIWLGSVYRGWAEQNPEGLAFYYLNNKNTLDMEALETAMEAWGKAAPVDAARFLSALGTAAERKEGALSLLKSLDAQDLNQFQKVIAQITTSQLDDSKVLNVIMDKWFSEDPSGAVSWMADLSPEQQKILEKYKDLGEVESVNSLLGLAKKQPDALSDKLESFPRWLKVETWAKIINEMKEGLSLPELIKWSERIPSDLRSDIMNSPYVGFSPFSGMSGDSPQIFEEVLSGFRSEDSSNWLTSIPGRSYERKFAARCPEEVLDFYYKTFGIGYVEAKPGIIAPWISKEPDKARKWLERMPFSEEQRKRIDWMIPFHSPLIAIDKHE